MRLIDVHACQPGPLYAIVQVDKAEIERQGKHVEYAILSHRWQQEEVAFEDLKGQAWQSKFGAQKLLATIALAKVDGHSHLWIDTCCINKDSSAELSEAINSMYQWYQQASMCYAYLCDVDEAMESSTWFTRGWTLQELIAPGEVRFLGSAWELLGTKTSLSERLQRITGVPMDVLKNAAHLERYSVATRMSWAARRTTERLEDSAYSLMGLFSVNMPLLYGEGARAFIRLQQEIINSTDDYTIFAWRQRPIDGAVHETQSLRASDKYGHGLLADSPADFTHSAGVSQYSEWRRMEPFSFTNRGPRLHLGIAEVGALQVAVLPCITAGQSTGFIGLWIAPLPGYSERYCRVDFHDWHLLHVGGQIRELYVPQSSSGLRESMAHYEVELYMAYRCHFNARHSMLSSRAKQFQTIGASQQGITFSSVGPIILPKAEYGLDVVILITDSSTRGFVLMMGICQDGQLGYDIKLVPKSISCPRKNASSLEAQKLDGIVHDLTEEEIIAFETWTQVEWAKLFEPKPAAHQQFIMTMRDGLYAIGVNLESTVARTADSICLSLDARVGDEATVAAALQVASEHRKSAGKGD